jgi:hypothetical protein
MKNMLRRMSLLFFLIVVWSLVACAGGNAVPTATSLPLPTNVRLPTATPLPSSTPTPRPTDTPAATDTPRPTNTPEATATSTGGSFGPITFAAGVLNDEKPVDPLNSFPDGVTIVYAFFSGKGIKDGTPWRSEWIWNGKLQDKLSKDNKWDAKVAGPEGLWWVSIYNDKGVGAGEWQLTLYLDNQQQQTAKFTIELNPSKQPDFGPIIFAPEIDSKDKPVNQLSVSDPSFKKGVTEVYAFFDGINVPKDTAWTSQWFENGDSVTDPKAHTWTFGPNENDWISFGNTDNTPLEAGTYELKLKIGDRLVNIGTFIVPK